MAMAKPVTTAVARHPFELLMGEEFVNEMNANVLLVLQHDPAKMADALSAIGYAYLAGDSPRTRMMVLARRARILANLRTLQPSSCYFEQALFLLLVLCAMELVTLAQPGHEATIPKILTNVASLIGHHLSTGGEISFVGRYLLRALARQDLVVSLAQMRRPCIPTYTWLDMTESHKADRLLGYTMTLMPLLEELCTMAEEVRSQVLRRPSVEFTVSESVGQAVDAMSPDFDAWLNATPSPPTPSDFHIRAESLRHRLSNWRPTINDALPFRSSRKFRAQAASYRAGALLYLHRLQNPPRPILRPVFHPPSSPSYLGSVPAAHLPFEEDATPAQFFADPSPRDAEALCLAHDIMLYA
ncbi:hypothetical protein F5X68DRAFT_258375 [Plectosphaerella plurivora]|uniref:Uncharacterized protein n=1 Tax=Plectosphaerella plurivora TaxID=936078 RepID=A0A9P9ABI5_9PEZI|nr:hypothetical protein F5X68DRAFT_258375 [Plectosphaerella plurivora]